MGDWETQRVEVLLVVLEFVPNVLGLSLCRISYGKVVCSRWVLKYTVVPATNLTPYQGTMVRQTKAQILQGIEDARIQREAIQVSLFIIRSIKS